MIQNGIRLFYRHFLVTKEETFSQKELQNPMFCMLYRFLMKDDRVENDAVKEITDFWAECGKNGTTEKIISYFPNKKIKGLLGISFSSELNGNKFPYGIGVEYDGREIKDTDLELVEIPAHTFAVFTCKGKMPEAFNEVYRKIVSEFFPQSTKYEYGWGVELEVYPSQDISNPDYTCEIWIAVKEK